MIHKKPFSCLLTACVLVSLSACGGESVKETLGINRSAPDEFRVVSRPPLSIPPQFDLRPPSATAESPTVVPADKQAQSILTGSEISETKRRSSSSGSQFLKNIGVDEADPSVRETLVKQRIAEQEKQSDSGWFSLLSSRKDKNATLVDAKSEAERIQKNKEANKPITEGETPQVKEKDRGIIGEIFGW